jgi:hypothetical protein
LLGFGLFLFKKSRQRGDSLAQSAQDSKSTQDESERDLSGSPANPQGGIVVHEAPANAASDTYELSAAPVNPKEIRHELG